MIVVAGGPFELYEVIHPETDEVVRSYWGAPSFGSLVGSLLDLSSQGQQSEASNVTARGNALFALDVPGPVPTEYHVFGTGTTDLAAITLDGRDRDAFRSLYGVAVPDSAATLADAVKFALTDGSDPTESGDGIGSLEPSKKRRGNAYELRVHFAGRSIREPFNASHRHVARWLARSQKSLERIAATHGEEHAGKVLDYMLTMAERAERRAVNEDAFKPASLKNLKRGNAETTVTDAFDSDTNSDYYKLVGGDTFDVSAGKARLQTFFFMDGDNVWGHNTALSSADHYSQMEVLAINGSAHQQGECVRCAGVGVDTYYLASNQPFTDTNRKMFKSIAGANTEIHGAVALAHVGTCKFEASGSNLDESRGETVHMSATDTAITGNLNAGFAYLNTGPSEWADIDDVELSDGLGGGGGGGGDAAAMKARRRRVCP